MKVLKFKVPVTEKYDATFEYLQNEAGKPNWKISWGTCSVELKLSFEQTLEWFCLTKGVWTNAVLTLLNQHDRFGVHLPEDGKLIAQMYLNWHHLPEETEGSWPLCTEHSPSGGRCARCGVATPDADESEEEEAELCDCGETEDNCTCQVCDFCSQKPADCQCILCDICNYCKCESKKHLRFHRLAPCNCDTPCKKRERKAKHGRLSCECNNEICEECQEHLDKCTCEEDSSSGLYEY